MKILRSGQFALVIDSTTGPGRDAVPHNPCRDDGEPISGLRGHFVFDRFAVDTNGFIRLTSTLPLGDLRGCVEIFGAELESLLKQACARYPDAAPQDNEIHRLPAE